MRDSKFIDLDPNLDNEFAKSLRAIQVNRAPDLNVLEDQNSPEFITKKLSYNLESIANSTKVLAINALRTSKEVVREVGTVLKEELLAPKQAIITSSLSMISPVLGYFIAKIIETPTFRKILRLPFVSKPREEEEYPSLQKGGLIVKGGLVNIHPAEVVSPIDKLPALLEEIGSIPKKEKSDIVSALYEIRDILKANEDEFEHVTGILRPPLKIFTAAFRPRGGYYRYLPKEENIFVNIRSMLQTLFVFMASRLDSIRGLIRSNVIATRDISTFFTGKVYQPLRDTIEQGYTWYEVATRGLSTFFDYITGKKKLGGLRGLLSKTWKLTKRALSYHVFYIAEPEKISEEVLKMEEQPTRIIPRYEELTKKEGKKVEERLGTHAEVEDVIKRIVTPEKPIPVHLECCDKILDVLNKLIGTTTEQVRDSEKAQEKEIGILSDIKENIHETSKTERETLSSIESIKTKASQIYEKAKHITGLGFILKLGSFILSPFKALLGIASPTEKKILTSLGIGGGVTVIALLAGLGLILLKIYSKISSLFDFFYKSPEQKRKEEQQRKGYATYTIPEGEYRRIKKFVTEPRREREKLLEEIERMPKWKRFLATPLIKMRLYSLEKREKGALEKWGSVLRTREDAYKLANKLKRRMSSECFAFIMSNLPDNNILNFGGTMKYLQDIDMIVYSDKEKRWITKDEYMKTMTEAEREQYIATLTRRRIERFMEEMKETDVFKSLEHLMKGGKKRAMQLASDIRAKIPKVTSAFDTYIQEASMKYGVSKDLIKAVIIAESSGIPTKYNPKKGASGLMQLTPQTASEVGVKNVFDPRENIIGGTKYLSKLLDKYNGDMIKALAAYNWGQGKVDRYGLEKMPSETTEYISKIMTYLGGSGYVEESKVAATPTKEFIASSKLGELELQREMMSNLAAELKEPIEKQTSALGKVYNNISTISNIILNNNVSNLTTSGGLGNLIDPSSLLIAQGAVP